MTQVLDRVCGFCVVFNSPSERPAGERREIIAPGALTAARSVFANVWHSARTSFAGTLTQSLQLTLRPAWGFHAGRRCRDTRGRGGPSHAPEQQPATVGNVAPIEHLGSRRTRRRGGPATAYAHSSRGDRARGAWYIADLPGDLVLARKHWPAGRLYDAAAERRWRINLGTSTALALSRAAGPAEPINLDTEAMRWARDDSARAASLARGRLQ